VRSRCVHNQAWSVMAKGKRSTIWNLIIYVALLWGLVIMGMLYWMHSSVNDQAAQDARRLRKGPVEEESQAMPETTDAPSTDFTTRKPKPRAKLPDLQPVRPPQPGDERKMGRERKVGEEKHESHVTYQNREKEAREKKYAPPPPGTRERWIHDMNNSYRKDIVREFMEYVGKEGTFVAATKKEWATHDNPITFKEALDYVCSWRKEHHPFQRVGLTEDDLEKVIQPLMFDQSFMMSNLRSEMTKLNETGSHMANLDRGWDMRVMQYIGVREVIKMTRYTAVIWEKLRDEKFDLQNLKNMRYPSDCMAIAGRTLAEAKFIRKFDLTFNDYDVACRMNAETLMESEDYFLKDNRKYQEARHAVTGEAPIGLMHLVGYIPMKDTHPWR